MPKKNYVEVLIDPRMASAAGSWLLKWSPPEPTILGGPISPKITQHLRSLGAQLAKVGRRKGGKRYVSIACDVALRFERTRFPCALSGVRVWPRAALKLRKRVEGALRRKRGGGRPSLSLDRVRLIVAGKITYEDERNLRRLKKRLAQAERELKEREQFAAWCAENTAKGGSILDPVIPLPKSP
jgi:hypothetical protein